MGQRAARGGHLEILQLAKSEGSSEFNDKIVAFAAARGGHIDILAWLKETNAPLESACMGAASGGQIEALKWLKARGYICKAAAYLDAAQEGHLEVMKWLKEEKGLWIPNATLSSAAKGGSVPVVSWLTEQGSGCGPHKRLTMQRLQETGTWCSG